MLSNKNILPKFVLWAMQLEMNFPKSFSKGDKSMPMVLIKSFEKLAKILKKIYLQAGKKFKEIDAEK